MQATRLFQNGGSQAIRIPQGMRTEKKDYYIDKIGEAYVIWPKDNPWAAAGRISDTFLEDIMRECNQPQHTDE